MRMRTTLWALTLAALLLAGCSSSAKMTGSSPVEAAAKQSATENEDDKSDFEKAIAESDTLDGMFTLYRDTTDGSLKMALEESQIGQEYIYFTHTVDGVLEAGHFRGSYRDNAVFKVRRHYDRIEFVEINTSFHFNDESALSRAEDANVSPSILHVEEIVARDSSSNRLLIEADNLFLTEALTQVKPPSIPGQGFGSFELGRQSREKSKVAEVHNYPKNTDVVVDYVFENPHPLNTGSDAVTDARNVTITMRHSLIQVPENDFEPRFADPRVGYFAVQKDDQTSTSATPYHDLINRWHLEKENPNAEISEPVEPITWWISNTTPERIRPVIRDAVLEWNDAFREAGFRNAVQVKVQPDTASWDAGDIRYNVLRWTSSPNPPFSGYGPSFVNPHTGQILGADVMLEYTFLRASVADNELFETAGMPLQSASDLPSNLPKHTCTLGSFLRANTLFGRAVEHAPSAGPEPAQNGPSDLEGQMTQLMEESLHYLALHEVGHTLGLMHNMKASQLHPVDEVHDGSLTREEGLVGSVMDYPAINVAPPGIDQGQYYTTRPGPYDVWAIEYGYSDASEEELEELLARSTEPELSFGNDADDMRAPGKAINPRVMIGDMSNEAIEYAADRLALAQDLTGTLLDKYEEPGQSYEELRNAYFAVTGQQAQMAAVLSRYIGGVYVDRAMIGQQGATQPYRPVPLDKQKQALELLRENVFAPDAFQMPNDLYRHLQPQRRGFNFFGNTEDPKIHARALGIQESVLAHLLHPTVLERMTDSRLYGNEYPLANYVEDLTDAVFAADADGNVNTFRQNLQISYVEGLANILSEEGREQYDHIAQSAALSSLHRVEDMIEGKRGVNAETEAHTEHLLLLIDEATSTE